MQGSGQAEWQWGWWWWNIKWWQGKDSYEKDMVSLIHLLFIQSAGLKKKSLDDDNDDPLREGSSKTINTDINDQIDVLIPNAMPKTPMKGKRVYLEDFENFTVK